MRAARAPSLKEKYRLEKDKIARTVKTKNEKQTSFARISSVNPKENR